MDCNSGFIDANLVVFGVLSAEMDRTAYCTEEAIWKRAGNEKYHKCSKELNVPFMKNIIKERCDG